MKYILDLDEMLKRISELSQFQDSLNTFVRLEDVVNAINSIPKSCVEDVYSKHGSDDSVVGVHVRGEFITSLKDAKQWLHSYMEDEPYMIWREDFSGDDVIFIVPSRAGEGLPEYRITSLGEFEEFVRSH